MYRLHLSASNEIALLFDNLKTTICYLIFSAILHLVELPHQQLLNRQQRQFVRLAVQSVSFEMLQIGLCIFGEDGTQPKPVNRNTKLTRFRSLYGSNPVVYSEMWEAFQTTSDVAAQIDKKNLITKYFFMTLYFLKCYPREHELSVLFRVDEKTARRWIKFYVEKIQKK